MLAASCNAIVWTAPYLSGDSYINAAGEGYCKVSEQSQHTRRMRMPLVVPCLCAKYNAGRLHAAPAAGVATFTLRYTSVSYLL